MVFSCNISWVLCFLNFLYKYEMSILTQKTLKKRIEFTGVGIHSGIKGNLKGLYKGDYKEL